MIRSLNDKQVRGLIYQAAVLLGLVALVVFFVRNASDNMVKSGIASGFDFLWRKSGIDVPFTLTGYTPDHSFLALFWAGVGNTILVSVLAMILATMLGFVIGLARLSSHWLLAKLAGAYVEFVRNIPLLFFVMFCYFGLLPMLPDAKNSLSLFGLLFLNTRGLTMPLPLQPLMLFIGAGTFFAGLLLYLMLARSARRRKMQTGRDTRLWPEALMLMLVIPCLAWAYAIAMTPWDVPQPGKFNLRGGLVLIPEFVALLIALVTYTAGFIAEIVRGGILAIQKGQWEAASSLGLTRFQALRFIVVPQALRIMIPPMTSQYLNVLKNSSFGAVIAYPEVVSLFMGSALNNTGQAIEIIAMVLAVYLFFGLIVSWLMNMFNSRMRVVSR